ncbi:rod shape-determining protein MreC [uncultured Eubacterium sp.]|uniref:rod shape-determining protein MreC n=1 Tax=uncultured Eubacterium sp. TaxID=165185 RepID=UPI0025DF5BC2|nr:rod shape-determining protein MreC [uncultured Eubacterium sp.]
MRKKKQSKFPAKYVLLIMTILCAVIIGCSLKASGSGPVSAAAGAVLAPMQKGVNQLGSGLTNLREHLRTKKSLEKENEELRTQLAEAQENLNQVQLNQEELDNLKSLYDMDQNYADYEKVAANVIGKDAGNWFSVFLIDRGSNDGITVGMNVLADGGLAGIVIQVGLNYAKVRSIIDDNSNVSARNLSTSDLCVVSGSLKTMNESSLIDFDDLRDKEDQAKVGDQIVTSNISDMFLEGIPIGYITDIKTDSNNLTKSGHIATIVDFEHLDDVFVILQIKDISTDTTNEQGGE